MAGYVIIRAELAQDTESNEAQEAIAACIECGDIFSSAEDAKKRAPHSHKVVFFATDTGCGGVVETID